MSAIAIPPHAVLLCVTVYVCPGDLDEYLTDIHPLTSVTVPCHPPVQVNIDLCVG